MCFSDDRNVKMESFRAKSDEALKHVARIELLIELKTKKINRLQKYYDRYVKRHSLKENPSDSLLDKIEFYAEEIAYQEEKLEVLEEEYKKRREILRIARENEIRFSQ